MKIPASVLRKYNNGVEPCANEAYNRQHGLGSVAMYSLFVATKVDRYGVFPGKITAAMIARFLASCPRGRAGRSGWLREAPAL